jgi:hypothetical protein
VKRFVAVNDVRRTTSVTDRTIDPGGVSGQGQTLEAARLGGSKIYGGQNQYNIAIQCIGHAKSARRPNDANERDLAYNDPEEAVSFP